MPKRLGETKVIDIDGEQFKIEPDHLVSFNNDENRTTLTYLYRIPDDEVYVLQIHHSFAEGKDDFQIINKDKARVRHSKNHPNKLIESI